MHVPPAAIHIAAVRGHLLRGSNIEASLTRRLVHRHLGLQRERNREEAKQQCQDGPSTPSYSLDVWHGQSLSRAPVRSAAYSIASASATVCARVRIPSTFVIRNSSSTREFTPATISFLPLRWHETKYTKQSN